MAFSDLTEMVLGAVTTALGETVTYTPLSGSGAVSVKAVYNEHFVELDGGIPVQTIQPHLFVRLSDLDAAPVQGDAVTVRAVSYTVHRTESDGEGGSLIFLKRA